MRVSIQGALPNLGELKEWGAYRNGSDRKRAMFFISASSFPSSTAVFGGGSTKPLGWSVIRSPRMRRSGAESWRSSGMAGNLMYLLSIACTVRAAT